MSKSSLDMTARELTDYNRSMVELKSKPTHTITDCFEADDCMTAASVKWPLQIAGQNGSFRVIKVRRDWFTAYCYETELTSCGNQAKIWNLIFAE